MNCTEELIKLFFKNGQGSEKAQRAKPCCVNLAIRVQSYNTVGEKTAPRGYVLDLHVHHGSSHTDTQIIKRF